MLAMYVSDTYGSGLADIRLDYAALPSGFGHFAFSYRFGFLILGLSFAVVRRPSRPHDPIPKRPIDGEIVLHTPSLMAMAK